MTPLDWFMAWFTLATIIFGGFTVFLIVSSTNLRRGPFG